ncbi:hypothetical protein [Pontiella sulfatireligans]|uniref:Uncharacterized protein n=1 Tax=Pontiella sulfatireligans TaxID=2750658 RepID=A0A6C2US97_9BACT|nr:hypothetical protein [Pontiella sulfatireligans]VGO23202.1 hypothetical protein SCARR_05309 [Pontiella sulfatireligans]
MWFEDNSQDGWDGKHADMEELKEKSSEDFINKAREIVDDFHSSGAFDEHEKNKRIDEHCEYRTSSDNRIAEQILQLEKVLEEYDQAYSDPYRDFVELDVYVSRIKLIVESLDEYRSKLDYYEKKERTIHDLYDSGKISGQEMDDRLTETGFRKQRAGTRTEMAGLGMTYDDLGEISDRFNHLAIDFQIDDNGDTRHKIFLLLRSMDRDKAIYILEQAVMDGMISQSTADYLIEHTLRSH